MEYFDRLKTWRQARQAFAAHLPAETLTALDDAAAFAIRCHGDQMRPSVVPVPYVEHLVETLDVLVTGAGVTDRDVLVAALLHDVVEDTTCTEEEVRTRFAARVAELVAWVTHDGDRAGYLRRLKDAPPDALLVKLADRVSNVQHLEQLAHRDSRPRYYRETVDHILPLATRHPWFRDWFAHWREEKKHLSAHG